MYPHFYKPDTLLVISLTHFELEQNPLVGFFTTIKETVWPTPPKECSEFLQRLAASGRPTRDLVACVIGLAVGSSVNYAQAVAQVVDFYLGADRAQERAALISVCKRDDAKSKELLKGYVREAMRLNPQFGGLFRVAVQDDVVPQGTGFQPLQVKTGDILFAGFKNAHLNVSSILFTSLLLFQRSMLTKQPHRPARRLPEPDGGGPDAPEGQLPAAGRGLPQLPRRRLRGGHDPGDHQDHLHVARAPPRAEPRWHMRELQPQQTRHGQQDVCDEHGQLEPVAWFAHCCCKFCLFVFCGCRDAFLLTVLCFAVWRLNIVMISSIFGFFSFSKLMFTCLHLYTNIPSIHIIFIVAAVYNIS